MRYTVFFFLLVSPAFANAASTAWNGTFVYAGGEGQKNGQQKAIHDGTQGMMAIAVPIARKEISDRNQVAPQLEISVAENRVTTTEVGPPTSGPADGTVTDFTSDKGEKVKLQQKLQGRTLVQTFATPRGTRENRFILAVDGKTLTEQVKISSPKLPRVIAYTLTYRRAAHTVTATAAR